MQLWDDVHLPTPSLVVESPSLREINRDLEHVRVPRLRCIRVVGTSLRRLVSAVVCQQAGQPLGGEYGRGSQSSLAQGSGRC